MSFIRTHVACPACGSSDGASINADGSAYCFVCSTLTPGTEGIIVIEPITPAVSDTSFIKAFNTGVPVSVSERRITKTTMEKYGTVRDNGKYYFPYYDNDSVLVASKVRAVDRKEFNAIGNWKAATLFGQNLYPSGGKYLTITEGEFDAMAAFQMTGSKWPVVSIRNGAASALKDPSVKQLKSARKWLRQADCREGDPGNMGEWKGLLETLQQKISKVQAAEKAKEKLDKVKRKKEETKSYINDEKFDLMIVDESHMIKNKDSIRGKIVSQIAENIPKVWLLTGTPIANRPMDYYNLLKVCQVPVTDNFQHFAYRYCAAKSFNKRLQSGKIKKTTIF